MAFDLHTDWEVRSNGTANGGGGFIVGAAGTDYSQQDAPEVVFTDAVIDAADATKATSILTPFTALHEGNTVYWGSGVGYTVQRAQILDVTAGVATFDKALGTLGSTGGNGNLGGAMTLINENIEIGEAGHHFYIKQDGTHTLVSDIVTLNDATAINPMKFIGYKDTRGDAYANGAVVVANLPVISGGAYGIIATASQYLIFQFLDMTGAGLYTIRLDRWTRLHGCKITNTSGTAAQYAVWSGNRDNIIHDCKISCALGFGTRHSTSDRMSGCYITDCNIGIETGSTNSILNTIIANCTTYGIDIGSDDSINIANCTFYNHKWAIITGGAASLTCVFENLIIDMCSQEAMGISPGDCNFYNHINWTNCAGFASTGAQLTETYNLTEIDPAFVDAPNGDFTPTGLLDGAAPNSWMGSATDNNASIGAVQLAGGGGAAPTIMHGCVG
ncbi:MAG TPA: hypothetical protein ENK70_00545 [Methylophaga sp.]|nr:hypothetical protein [Methylophaga sp.]